MDPGCRRAIAVLAGSIAVSTALAGEWVEFVDETATRLVADPAVGAADEAEKDYAWGDVDRDGDVDLVVARKQPYATSGRRTNVLLLNEDGVLVDRTATFAVASDVPGDLGFLTPTNDRDVQLVDVDRDGWLDVVTAPTISDGAPKHVGHPRIYVNRGADAGGAWLGLRYEAARIPALDSYSGQAGFNPRFVSLAAGDVTGDGYPDLWFGDQDAGTPPQPPGADFNDRLLVNLGAAGPGYFVDATNGEDSRFLGGISFPSGDVPFPLSAYGAAGAIADLDSDGRNDIVKQTGMNVPIYVGVAYAAAEQQGFFDSYDVLSQNAPYFVSVADLNNDDLPDLVLSDDGLDRYLLNAGNDEDGVAQLVPYVVTFAHDGLGAPAGDEGFASNNLAADLDNDGWDDVLIADVHVDIPGCARRLHVFRNLGGAPGDAVILQEQTSGSGCSTTQGNPPSCRVAGIPADRLEGVHDVAVFDIDGDGWNDLVVGRCGSTEVYRGQPPAAAGSVAAEDGGGAAQPLTAAKLAGGLRLAWGESCSALDLDYVVYQGHLGDWDSHVPVTCTTGGATEHELEPITEDAYYLVVPTNGVAEGSAGVTGAGAERPIGADSCLPRSVGVCGN